MESVLSYPIESPDNQSISTVAPVQTCSKVTAAQTCTNGTQNPVPEEEKSELFKLIMSTDFNQI